MQRRSLFKWGLAGAVVLAVGGGLVALVRPGWNGGKLTPAGRDIFGAVARAVLDGVLPAASAQRDAAVAAHLTRVEATINGLPPRTQAEVAQLLALIGHPAGRRALVGLGPDWGQASIPEVQAALQSLRKADTAALQQVYHALHDLTNGSYFADSSTWAAVGYPGPRAI